MDSDDIWYPDKLTTQLEFISSNKAGMVFSSYDVMNESKNFIRKVNASAKVSYKDIISKNPIGCLFSFLVNREVIVFLRKFRFGKTKKKSLREELGMKIMIQMICWLSL